MFDARTLVAFYLEKPNKNVLVHRYDASMFYVTMPELERFGKGQDPWQGKIASLKDYCVFYCRRSEAIVEAREDFLKKKRLFSKVDPSLCHSTPKFNSFLKKRGLWEEYMESFLDRYATVFADFFYENELTEIEAPQKDYDAIGKLLREYESHGFWKMFSDSVFFDAILGPSGGSQFVVMGNRGQTYGISFYRGITGYHAYELLFYEEINASELLTHSVGCLSQALSLYCDKAVDPAMKDEKPIYDGEPRYWSICINRSAMTKNYLGVALAKSLKAQLRTAIDVLKDFKTQQLPKDFGKMEANVYVMEFAGQYHFKVEPRDIDYDHPLRFISSSNYQDILPCYQAKKMKNRIYSFAIRPIPGGAFHDEEDPRFGFSSCLALICDDESGMVLAPVVAKHNNGAPFLENLANDAYPYVSGLFTPREILVNSELDFQIAEFLLHPFILAGAILSYVDQDLATDEAYEAMMDAMKENVAKA